jgi:hypothetical protein
MDRTKKVEVRVLFNVRRQGCLLFPRQLRQFVKIVLNRDAIDGSLYILPYSLKRLYRGEAFTLKHVGNGEYETKLDTASSPISVNEGVPHISLHETGEVHAYITEGVRFGETITQPISELHDEHIASITIDSFKSLPLIKTKPNLDRSLPQYDEIIDAVETGRSHTFSLWVNSGEDKFKAKCFIKIGMPAYEGRLAIYYGIGHREHHLDLDEENRSNPGIAVLAGWDIRKLNKNEDTQMIGIRGT